MKNVKIVWGFIILPLLFSVFLFSCSQVAVPDPEPLLEITVLGDLSIAVYGSFIIDLWIRNLGNGDAWDINYELIIYGSAELPINYTFDMSPSGSGQYVGIPRTIESGAVSDCILKGDSVVYVPWYYRLTINYEDPWGNSQEPIEIYRQFRVQ